MEAPVAQWTFRTGSVLDASQNGHDGALVNGAQIVFAELYDGTVGAVLETDGSSAYAQIPGHTDFDLSNAHTLAVWVYPLTLDASGKTAIITHGESFSSDTVSYTHLTLPTILRV